MGQIRERIHIDAPPEKVWKLGAQAELYPEWQTGVVQVRDVSGPIDHVGASYTVIYRTMGRQLDATFTVTKVELGRLIEEEGTAPGGGRGTSKLMLDPADGGTDLSFEFDYDLPGGFVGDIADKLFLERAIQRDIHHSQENFKELCQAKIPASV